MSEDLLGKQLETLFQMPPGSFSSIEKDKVTNVLVNKVTQKTSALSDQLKTNDTLSNLPVPDLVKNGIDLDQLEQDRVLIRNEAFEVYRIGKALLTKLYNDVKDQIGVNDRMYTACSKMIDTVNNSLIRLFEMNQKLKQDEEFRALTSNVDGNQDGTRNMSTDEWMEWVEKAKELEDSTNNKSEHVQDAIIK